MTNNKYKAEGFWYNPESKMIALETDGQKVWYASKLEFRTHQLIRKYLPPKCIVRQYKIHLKPATAYYPGKSWCCDYAIWSPKCLPLSVVPVLLIESKGLVTREFLNLLPDLDYFSPHFFEKLIVVGVKHQELDKNVTMLDLSELETRLRLCFGKQK